jgi:LacI family transcriptional regulator
MTRHLVASGRQRVAFITGARGNDEAAQRLAGYHAGLAPGMRAMVFDGDFSEESGWAAGRRIASHRPRPDAVFAANDMMAVACMAALREAGLRVPEDIAVAGFDDIPIARYVTPALTTIRVPIAALGAAALDALVETIESPADATTQTVVTPVELVVRRSCGAGASPPPQAPRPQPQVPRRAPPH